MVLVTAANGRVGSAAVDALVRLEVPVRAGARNLVAGRARHPEAEVVPLDLTAPATWDPALDGVGHLVLIVPTDHFDPAPILALVQRAERVSRVVLLSAHGIEERPHPMQAVEAAVQARDLWHIARPTTFAQGLFDASAAADAQQGEVTLPMGEGRAAFVDATDVGEALARLATLDAAPRAWHLTGPHALDGVALAMVWSTLLDHDVRYAPMSPSAFADRLARTGLPKPVIEMLVGFHQDLADGVMAQVSADLPTLLGRGPRSVLAVGARQHIPLARLPTPDAAAFMGRLAAHNDRDWFRANRKAFDAAVSTPLDRALASMGAALGGRAQRFRQFQSVRFHKNRPPLKTTCYGVIVDRPGTASGLYLQIDPVGLYAGCGYHDLAKDQLHTFRQAVDSPAGDRLDEAARCVEAAGLVVEGKRLRTVPRGFSRHHPHARWLAHQEVLVGRRWSVDTWPAPEHWLAEVEAVWGAAEPLVRWLDAHVGPSRIPPEQRYGRSRATR
ncbi:MAG: DUF2461 family protein [Myxococcales bacterium]|nr:DUF2461 family protein [Myxococcales bacterium]